MKYKIHRGYAALLAAATKLDLPKSFHTDLTVHDRKAVARFDESEPFGWAVNEHGTYLFDPMAIRKDRSRRRSKALRPEHVHGLGMGETHYFFWDGVALVDCTGWEGCERMLHEASLEVA